MPLQNSCEFDVIAVSEALRSCVLIAESYLVNHSCPIYDVLPDSVVLVARVPVSYMPDF